MNNQKKEPTLKMIIEKESIKVGDRIRILQESGTTIEGRLMPRAPSKDEREDIIVIKFDNGYNAGFRITSKTKIEKIKEEISGAIPKPLNSHPDVSLSLPSIHILSTGGTVASRVDYKIGGVYAHFTATDLIEMFPEIASIADIKTETILQKMSEDITPDDWILMANHIARCLNEGSKGVVVTHGTDTMHYSAAALSFLLKDLTGPVILTGAQRSSDRGSTDSAMNLICSVNIAACTDIGEVCVVMHGTTNDDYCLVHRGTKVRKMHTSRRDAFRSINDHPLGKVYEDGRIEITEKYSKAGKGTTWVDGKLEKKVALIKFYPGLSPDVVDFYLDRGYQGIVIEGTGLGHVHVSTSDYSLLPKIEKAISMGVPVVITSQCLYGRVHPHVYRNLIEVSRRGAIYAEDMLPEVAYIKLMYVLGQTKRLEEIKRMMTTNISGEISCCSSVDTFLS